MSDSVEDLKTLRNWVLGIAGFSTAVSTFLVQVLHFPTEPTLAGVCVFACFMLLIVYLINKAEQRQKARLDQHIKESESTTNNLGTRLDKIDEILLDIQRSTLRTEMNDEINRHPENHDTILRMAEKYFLGLDADWVQTNIFCEWVENEKKAGRPVNVPKILSKDVDSKRVNEI